MGFWGYHGLPWFHGVLNPLSKGFSMTSIIGGFLKSLIPKTMGFNAKVIEFGWLGGCHKDWKPSNGKPLSSLKGSTSGSTATVNFASTIQMGSTLKFWTLPFPRNQSNTSSVVVELLSNVEKNQSSSKHTVNSASKISKFLIRWIYRVKNKSSSKFP